MPVSISGQVVMIVGASSGIGRAAAVLFAREGCKVVAAARREDRLQSLQRGTGERTTRDYGLSRRRIEFIEDMQQLAQETLQQFWKSRYSGLASGINTR